MRRSAPREEGRGTRQLGRMLAVMALLPAFFHVTVAPAAVSQAVFVPVLIYHHVKWLKPSDNAIERGLTVQPDQFQQEMIYLARDHFHPVTAARLVAALTGGASLPSRPVVLTFDDGYTDVYGSAYRTLQRYHMTATFFIVPGFLNTPRYLTWARVEDMARHGMDIEAHTMTHPDLTLVPLPRARAELVQSRQLLERRLHRPVRVLAYPYGDYNAPVLSAVQRAGYQGAFSTHQGWWERRNDLLALPRVYVDLDDTPAIFAGRLKGDPAVLAADPI